jgi:hypothetical protein
MVPRIFVALLVGSLFAVSVAQAAPISVSFNFYDSWEKAGGGTFVGTDGNSNGLIEFSELSSFSATVIMTGETLNLGNLVDTGDYIISTNHWEPNGISWKYFPSNAFFTWNSRESSVDSTWATVETSVTAVPEPETYAMMMAGLGLFGFMAKRKKSA